MRKEVNARHRMVHALGACSRLVDEDVPEIAETARTTGTAHLCLVCPLELSAAHLERWMRMATQLMTELAFVHRNAPSVLSDSTPSLFVIKPSGRLVFFNQDWLLQVLDDPAGVNGVYALAKIDDRRVLHSLAELPPGQVALVYDPSDSNVHPHMVRWRCSITRAIIPIGKTPCKSSCLVRHDRGVLVQLPLTSA